MLYSVDFRVDGLAIIIVVEIAKYGKSENILEIGSLP